MWQTLCLSLKLCHWGKRGAVPNAGAMLPECCHVLCCAVAFVFGEQILRMGVLTGVDSRPGIGLPGEKLIRAHGYVPSSFPFNSASFSNFPGQEIFTGHHAFAGFLLQFAACAFSDLPAFFPCISIFRHPRCINTFGNLASGKYRQCLFFVHHPTYHPASPGRSIRRSSANPSKP